MTIQLKLTEVKIMWFSHKSSVNTISMVSLTAKFEGGPLDLGAQTRVGWFSTLQCYSLFLKTAEIEGDEQWSQYGTLPHAKLCSVICQTGRSCRAKKLTNSDILLFRLFFET